MSWPSLTEAWATTYLQVAISLFVFALGLPSLILPLIVPDYLQAVASRNRGTLSAERLGLAIGGTALILIWICHPGGTRLPSVGVGQFSIGGLVLGPWQLGPMPTAWQDAAVAVLATVMIVGSALYWFSEARRSTLDGVVHELGRTIVGGFRRNGRVNEERLEQLVFIGTEAQMGFETNVVLVELDRVAKSIMACNFDGKAKYRGDELKEVINGIVTIVTSSVSSSNDANLLKGGSILDSLRRGGDGSPGSSLDCHQAGLALEDLAVAAVGSCSDATALSLLQYVRHRRESLFEVGSVALRNRKHLLALAALDLLEARVDEEGFGGDRDAAALLGLAAQFSDAGSAASMRSAMAVKRLFGRMSALEAQEAIVAAWRMYWATARYDTADCLARLLPEEAQQSLRGLIENY